MSTSDDANAAANTARSFPKNRTIYLIDGTAYIHRAFHAIRGLTNSKGFPTNAIFGFARMLLKLIEDKAPRYAAMIFDVLLSMASVESICTSPMRTISFSYTSTILYPPAR